jgi:hypothetical protein
MLFLERNALNYSVDREGRTKLLQELQEQNLTPLILSTRQRCFEAVLGGSERTDELEAAILPGPNRQPGSHLPEETFFVFPITFCFFSSKTTMDQIP